MGVNFIDREYNDQKIKDEKTENGLQKLYRNQEIEQHEPHKSYTEIKRLNNTNLTKATQKSRD